jgi:TP901 family phage tail tape measure protein
MATQAGKAYVTVAYDPASVRSLGSTTARESKRYESSWLGSARRVALGLGGAFLGIEAAKQLFVEPIKQAGDFQRTLNVLQATVGATNGQMRRAQAESIKLGADIRLPSTSAADAATAMTELGKAGFTASQAMRAARGTLLLAAAAQTDEATAATIAANAINAFNLHASQSKTVADLLAGAANASSADITDLADSLRYAGTGAHQAGQSIQDTITAIAEMSNAGQSGSTAGSALAQMFRSLQAPSSKAADAMKKFGLDVYDTQGRMKPLPALVDLFSSHLNGLTQKQKAQTLATIFGSRAIRAAQIVLLGGAKSYDQLRDKVTKADAAQRLATAQTKGFNGALQGLQSAFETLQIEIGLKALPALTGVVDAISKIASAPSLSVAVKVAFQGIKAGASDIGGALHDELFGQTKTTTIKAPSGLVVGRSQVQTKGLVSSIGDAIKNADWSTIGGEISSAIGKSIQFTGRAISFSAKSVTALSAGIVAAFITGLHDHDEEISHSVGSIFVESILLGLADLVNPVWWAQHWRIAAGVAIAALTTAFLPAKILAPLRALPFARFLIGPLERLGGPLRIVVEALGGGIVRGLRDVFPEVANASERIGTRIIGPLRTVPARARNIIEDFGRLIGRELGNAARVAGGEAVRIGSRIIDALDGFIGRAGAAATRIVGRIVAPFESLAGRITGPVIRAGRRVIDAIGGFVGQAFSTAAAIGRAITDGIISGLSSLFSRVSSAISSSVHNAIDFAKNHIGSTAEEYAARQIGHPIGEGIAGGVEDHTARMQQAIRSSVRTAIGSGGGGGRGDGGGHRQPIQLNVDLGDGIRQIVTTHIDLTALMLGGRP